MKSFDEWKEANLDEQAAAPGAMAKLEKAKLMGRPAALLAKFIESVGGATLTRARKLAVLAQVADALDVSTQEMGMMGAKVKGAIKKDAGGLAGKVTKPVGVPPAE